MTERKLIRLEVRTNDGEMKVFDEDPSFNFDVPTNCFIVSFETICWSIKIKNWLLIENFYLSVVRSHL